MVDCLFLFDERSQCDSHSDEPNVGHFNKSRRKAKINVLQLPSNRQFQLPGTAGTRRDANDVTCFGSTIPMCVALMGYLPNCIGTE